MTLTLQQAETLLAALEARNAALQRQVDELDTRVAALVENVNELRGDRQRTEARERVERRENGPRSPMAQAGGNRREADRAERERRVQHGQPAGIE